METALTLDVITANIKNDNGRADEGKRFQENLFRKHQPDAVLIQQNPWSGDEIKNHVKAIGENYNTKYGTTGTNRTAVLYRKTSSPKLDCIEVSVPSGMWQLESPPRYGFAIDFAERATVALFEAKGKLARGSGPRRLFMISWHGENNVHLDKKRKAFQELLRFVNVLHDGYDSHSQPIPVVLGGDFNLKNEDTKVEVLSAGLRLVDCPPLPSRRPNGSSIDYNFIVAKDIQVDRTYAIPYEVDPNRGDSFNHAPVMVRLTFSDIKIKTARDNIESIDVLVTNLKTMLSQEEPKIACACNKDESWCLRTGVIRLLACQHTFHLKCLADDKPCPACERGEGSNEAVSSARPDLLKHPTTVLPRVIIHPILYTHMDSVITCWHFFLNHCQSELVERMNTKCDVAITLTLCRLFFNSCEIPAPRQPLSQSWIYRVIRAILIGEKLLSKMCTTWLQTEQESEISMVIQMLKGILHFTERESGTKVNWNNLSDKILARPQTAVLCILLQKTVAFVPFHGSVLLLDTHSHGSTGALVAIASRDNVSKLVSWFKAFDKQNDKMLQCHIIEYSPSSFAASELFQNPVHPTTEGQGISEGWGSLIAGISRWWGGSTQ